MKKIYAIFVTLVLICTMLKAQGSMDSLWRVWHNATLPDTTRLDALQRLAYRYVNNDPDSARAIAEVQLAFAQKRICPDGRAERSIPSDLPIVSKAILRRHCSATSKASPCWKIRAT
ncbi:MAG: hypothetical protein IPM82_26600 [Saprospiraceae bacterium]|nr:hypothetical protein [Saprospiraceae bacterium]